MSKLNLLITGSSGQLGVQLKKISPNFPNFNFFFKDKIELDITNFSSVENFVRKYKIDVLINCAAYTNVDLAEEQKELVNLINNVSVGFLAKICSENKIQLIHISTDFVFDGNKKFPYNEDDITNPLNFYGLSKLNGEKQILKNSNLKKSLIIRTSWLYCESKNNFVSKIISKILANENIMVVKDQFGSPTRTKDLALAILKIIPKIKNLNTEIFHFCNEGYCSKLNLANHINLILKGKSKIIPVETTNTIILRPKFSSLDTSKFKDKFDFEINDWKKSLMNYFIDSDIKNFNRNEL